MADIFLLNVSLSSVYRRGEKTLGRKMAWTSSVSSSRFSVFSKKTLFSKKNIQNGSGELSEND